MRLSPWCRWGAPALFLFALLLCGCGGTSKITGKVTFQGSPLKGGYIAFVNSDGKAWVGPIEQDGSYSVANVPTGEMKITVETSSQKRAAAAPSYKPPEDAPAGGYKPPPVVDRYTAIPKIYENADDTPLTVTVKSGKMEHNINLEGMPEMDSAKKGGMKEKYGSGSGSSRPQQK